MGPCQSKTASWALGSAWRRRHQGASGQGDVEGEGGAASVAAEQERSAEESRNARLTTRSSCNAPHRKGNSKKLQVCSRPHDSGSLPNRGSVMSRGAGSIWHCQTGIASRQSIFTLLVFTRQSTILSVCQCACVDTQESQQTDGGATGQWTPRDTGTDHTAQTLQIPSGHSMVGSKLNGVNG